MSRTLVALLIASALPALALAQATPKAASPAGSPFSAGGSPPLISATDGIKDGQLLFRMPYLAREARMTTVEEKVPYTEGGQTKYRTEKRQLPETVLVTRYNTQKIPLDRVRAFGADGKPIAPATLATQLARPAFVLFTTEGQPVDKAFLGVARPGIPLLVLPPSPPPPMVPGVVIEATPAPATATKPAAK